MEASTWYYLTHDVPRLRRAFLLLDPLHGLLDHDMATLALLSAHCIPTQIVLSKVDRMLPRPLLSLAHFPAPQSAPDKLISLQSTFQELAESMMSRIRQEASKPERSVKLVGLADEVVGVGCGLGDGRAKTNRGSTTVGVAALRWAVLRACGLDGL